MIQSLSMGSVERLRCQFINLNYYCLACPALKKRELADNYDVNWYFGLQQLHVAHERFVTVYPPLYGKT